MLETHGGITRAVLLIGKFAIKVPRVRYGWDKFLRGLLSNMTEARFSCLADKFVLAPVIFAIPGGWLNIQRRCEPLTEEEWQSIHANDDDVHNPGHWNGFFCDFKRNNFGTLDGKIVLLDFGELA